MARFEMVDVLRYWHSTIRHEESLTTYPKAVRTPGMDSVDWARPSGMHSYFKVLTSDAFSSWFQRHSKHFDSDVNPEHLSFFGRRLRQHYGRQDRFAASNSDHPEVMLVGFPVLYFPRTDELATLFRMVVELEWFDGQGEKVPLPSKRQRKMGTFPNEPVRYRLTRLDAEDDLVFPYVLDSKVFSEHLGFTEEDIEAYIQSLRDKTEFSPVEIFTSLMERLGAETQNQENSSDSTEMFKDFVTAIQRRLSEVSPSVRVFDRALVFEGKSSPTTHHLKRDLNHLIKSAYSLSKRSPLRTYLTTVKPSISVQPLVGQYAPQGSTVSQRAVAESFLGSSFVAAQGPPGTGKTRLILDLAAHTLIQRMLSVVGLGRAKPPRLLVTSTNNRAVDEVFRRLGQDLPWALRAGSQQVTEQVTVEILDSVLTFLDSDDIGVDFGSEKRRFVELYEAVILECQPYLSKVTQGKEHLEWCQHRERLTALQKPKLSGTELQLLTADVPKLVGAVDDLVRLRGRLDGYAQLLVMRVVPTLPTLLSTWKKIKKDLWQPVQESLSALGLGVMDAPVCQPKAGAKLAEVLSEWRRNIESALTLIDDDVLLLGDVIEYINAQSLLKEMGAEPSSGLKSDDAVDFDIVNWAQYRLFQGALRLRKAWVWAHRDEMRHLVTAMKSCALEQRSLKRLLSRTLIDQTQLFHLFPVWGSTLLSLGNVFPPEFESIDYVVIDEGGQCHPAYVVSAFMRAKHAMIIGDVHQLEPIFTLSVDEETRILEALDGASEAIKERAFRVFENCGHSAQRSAELVCDSPKKLTEHFRSVPEIVTICDKICSYGLNVRTPKATTRFAEGILTAPHLMVPTYGVQRRNRGSWCNQKELQTIIQLLIALSKQGVNWDDVAVLTPYAGQLEALRQTFFDRRSSNSYDSLSSQLGRPTFGTVHRFQGGEKEIVLFSAVVSEVRSLHFQNRRCNLVNVALSRAKRHFVTVGNPETLRQGEFTRWLVEDAVVRRIEDIV